MAAATVTITEDPPLDSNRANAVEDVVSLSAQAQDQLGLTDSERAYVKRLQAADAAVRTHEGLHFRAASGLGQLPEFQTVTGPDGNQYAVAGSVNVSSTPGVDSERASREAETLGIAATAPGDASAADFSAAKKFGSNTARPETLLKPSQTEPPGSLVNLIA